MFFRSFYDDVGQPDRLGSALLATTGQVMASSSAYAGTPQAGEAIGQMAWIGSLSDISTTPTVFTGRLLPAGTEQLAASVRIEGWPLLAVEARGRAMPKAKGTAETISTGVLHRMA